MIKYTKDTDGIVTLTLDMSDSPVNIINHEVGRAFIPAIQQLQKEKEKGELGGVIITSAKKTFLAGGDLDYLYETKDASEIFNYIEQLNNIFRSLEFPGVPVVAALNGSALGSGYELTLACHYRIALDDPDSRIGLPEVNLGLMPGSGGVIRLLWLLGLEQAFKILVSGRVYRPQEALKEGLVDEVAMDEDDMIQKARNFIYKNKNVCQRWDKPEGKIRRGTLKTWRNARFVAEQTASFSKNGHNNFPAKQAILSTLVEGTAVGFDTAVRIGSRYFTRLIMGQTARNMTKTFWYDYNAIKKNANRPKGFGKFRPGKIGVIGAGLMGSGIACQCAVSGLEVVLKDISKPVAERGKELSVQFLKDKVAEGKLTKDEKTNILNRITATESAEVFKDCDIVIEAVFENATVKSKVTREAQLYMEEESIFVSTTSTLSISELAKATNDPTDFIGLRFFSPVTQSRIVEVVRGEKTSEETLARAFDFVKKLKKIPIIVKDNLGFFVERVYNQYLLEGILLLKEGVLPATIEQAGRKAGMTFPPLAGCDKNGLKNVRVIGGKFGDQQAALEVIDLLTNEYKRNGKVNSSGFYEYESNNEQYLWSELKELFPPKKDQPDFSEVMKRLLFVQVLEAVRCLEEGVIQTVGEANLGSIYGWGFASFKGGVIQFINDFGIENFIMKSESMEELYGARFGVPKMLKSALKNPDSLK